MKKETLQSCCSDTSGFDLIVSALLFLFILLANCIELLTRPVGFITIMLGLICFKTYGRYYGSLINAKGILSTSWMVSIGLSLIRIHPDQIEWSLMTILCISVALPLFMFGYNTYFHFQQFHRRKYTTGSYSEIDSDAFRFVLLIWCLLVASGLAADCIYSKSLPVFGESQSAYMSFGMPYVHYLTVSCCFLPSLYFCYLKSAQLIISNDKSLFAFVSFCSIVPLLIVSRQLMLLELILFTMTYFIFGGKENLITLGKICALILGVLVLWTFLSSFRNQSTAYLASVFNLPLTTSKNEMSFWQLYLYISFNFDNFNYLISNLNQFSFGVNTAFPLLVLTASKSMVPSDLLSTSGLMLLPTFNTYPFITPAYRDFGLLGVVLYSFFIGYFSCCIEMKARTLNNPFIHLGYYLVLYSLAISFFVSEFAQPVFWIYVLLLFAADLLVRSVYRRNG